jgi:hypothetical protein
MTRRPLAAIVAMCCAHPPRSAATSHRPDVCGARLYCIHDTARWSRGSRLRIAAQAAWVVPRTRPDAVISSGSAPGLVVLRVGERLRARTLWHVSIANMDGLSRPGQRAAHFADLHFTPWHHLQPVGAPRTRRGVLISPIAGSALAGGVGRAAGKWAQDHPGVDVLAHTLRDITRCATTSPGSCRASCPTMAR